MNLIVRKSPKLAKIWSEGRPLKRQVTFQQGGWSLRNASQSHRGPGGLRGHTHYSKCTTGSKGSVTGCNYHC